MCGLIAFPRPFFRYRALDLFYSSALREQKNGLKQLHVLQFGKKQSDLSHLWRTGRKRLALMRLSPAEIIQESFSTCRRRLRGKISTSNQLKLFKANGITAIIAIFSVGKRSTGVSSGWFFKAAPHLRMEYPKHHCKVFSTELSSLALLEGLFGISTVENFELKFPVRREQLWRSVGSTARLGQ